MRNAADQEQVRLDDDIVHDREHTAGNGQRRIERQSQYHVTNLTDDMKREDTTKFILSGGA